jgi:hypothetical protein
MVQSTNDQDFALRSMNYQQKCEVDLLRRSNNDAPAIARDFRITWPLDEFSKD